MSKRLTKMRNLSGERGLLAAMIAQSAQDVTDHRCDNVTKASALEFFGSSDYRRYMELIKLHPDMLPDNWR